MRGSLRIRHQAACPASSSGRAKDPRACRCSPSVQGRVAGVSRSLGHLPRGWLAADLIEFEHRLADLRGLVLEGRPPAPTRVVTLAEFAGPWFERIAAQVEMGRMSPLTYNRYEGDWRNYLKPAFGRLPLAAIDQAQLIRFMRDGMSAGLSESTVKGKLIVLCGMLTDAVAEGHIASNPLRTPKRARHRGGGRDVVFDLQPERKPPKHLEPVEARALLAAAPAQFRDLVLCALTTGFRRGELLGLQWEWIDFGARTIDLRGQVFWRLTGESRSREPTIRGCKYDSEREVPLWDGLAELLGPRRQATGWVFLNPETGQPWRETRPAQVFLEDTYEAAGLRRAGRMWHQLRHTYASVLAAGGVRRHEVEQLLGHKSQGTTGLYTHLFRDSYETVHAALDAVYGRGSSTSPRSTPAVVATPTRVSRTGRF